MQDSSMNNTDIQYNVNTDISQLDHHKHCCNANDGMKMAMLMLTVTVLMVMAKEKTMPIMLMMMNVA